MHEHMMQDSVRLLYLRYCYDIPSAKNYKYIEFGSNHESGSFQQMKLIAL